MALKPLNSVAGFSVGETPSNIILANGDISATNFTASGKSNLNAIGNVIITGGSGGQVIQTDGAGNLSFVTINTAQLANGNSNVQVLANSNITFSVAGVANIGTFTGTGLDVSGYVVAGNITANGNISVNNYIVTPATVDLVVAPNTQITRFYSNVNPFSGGYSLGNNLARWDNVYANTANIDGNVSAGNVLTNNLLYANGQPWDLQEAAGSNTQIQYNDGSNNFGASAAFTFDYTGNILTVTGNANITSTLNGNVGNFSGNITSLNANLGNLATANFINVASNLVTSNLVANTNVDFTGSGNVTLGNVSNLHIAGGSLDQILKTDGNGNLSWSSGTSLANGYSNVTIPNANGNVIINANAGVDQQWTFGTDGNLTGPANGLANLGNLVIANFANIASNTTTSNLTVNLELSGNTANFSGNVTTLNANLGNLVTANFANVSSNLYVTDTANVGNLRTNNLLYANGNPWDLQEAAGANTQIQYNDGSNNFGASANFTWDYLGNVLTVDGNANVTGTTKTANAQVTTISNTQVVYANATSFLVGSANYTFDDVASNLSVVGNIIATNFVGNISGNISAPGSNTNILFNDAGTTNASNNFTYDKVSQQFTVNGNAQFNNANLGNLGYANFIDVSSNLVTNNLSVNLSLAGNTANFSGNVVAGNLSTTGSGGNISGANVVSANTFVGNVSASTANISGNLVTNNLTVNLELAGNTANFSGNLKVSGVELQVVNNLAGNTANFAGNISSLNANLGNIVDANYIRTQQLYNGTANIDIINNGNIAFSPTVGNVMIVSSAGANIVGYVSANGNGTFGAIKSNSVTAQGGNLELYSEQAGNTYIQLRPFGDGTVDVGNVRITSLAMPNASSDAATKQYVDDVAQGLNVHDSALAATANSLANLTGGVITYNNGASGVGANLVLSGTPTANYLSANVFDGNVTAIVTSRILVKDEANAAFNGIYVVSNATVLTRATDFNSVPEVEAGDFVFVQDGTTYNDSGWVQTSVVAVIGTDPINWTQFSGAGTYQAGQGLTLTGTVFSVNVDNITTEISGGNVIVKANAQFTTPNIGAATGTSVDLTGNVLAGNVNSNAKVTAVDFEASGNIIAANISANANLIVNNATVNLELSGNTANFSGNVILPNVTVNLELAGNTANFSGNVTTLNANLGNLATANFANIASNLTTSNLTVNLELSGNTANFSGNIVTLNANLGNLATANYFTGTLVNGTSNIVVTSSGNINLTAGANTSLVVTDTGANITGNLGVSGNFSVGNLVADNLTANTNIFLGNTTITWDTVTTTNITANQTIATLSTTGITGLEFLVKGVDATGSKYSVATVQAVTDGTSVDFSTFATVNLGGSTGSLVVNIVSGNVELQVTPASSNSTVWTTQARTI